MLDEALQAEMEAHVSVEEREKGNKRNSLRQKTVKTSTGELSITTLQDRYSTFEPETIKKRNHASSSA